MNYSHFIIKIVNKPEQSSFKNGILVTEFIGKFYQFRKRKIASIDRLCKISIWGKAGSNFIKNYKKNDYLIVEGILSLRKSDFEDSNLTTDLEISVYKFYPLSLKSISLKK
jgi:single-stranded DNA-binding protein